MIWVLALLIVVEAGKVVLVSAEFSTHADCARALALVQFAGPGRVLQGACLPTQEFTS